MAAGITLKMKRKAGAFTNGQLAAGEWGLDVTNSAWYYSINGTTVELLDTGSGSTLLSALTDVIIASAADNDILAYDSGSGKWTNQTAAQAGLLTTAQKGAASGLAELDAGGKVPVAQLPDTVLGSVEYKGTWNASTNSPNIGAGGPSKGDYYVVSTAGSTSLGGITDWKLGDWAIYNGTGWEKVDNTDGIASVFGRTGTVVAVAGDYDASQVDNDSAVTGTTVKDALNTLNTGKAATSHNHNASDINAGDLAAARMSTNLVSALNSTTGTAANSGLTLDGGTL